MAINRNPRRELITPKTIQTKNLLATLASGILLTLGFSLWLLTRPQGLTPEPGQLTVHFVEFSTLKGWGADDQTAALGPFLKSCSKILNWPKDRALGGFGGTASDWITVCEAARVLQPATLAQARKFFEQNFKVVEIAIAGRAAGLFTGYFEPELRGSRVKKAPYIHPLYGLPHDLIRVDLSEFRHELKGKQIVGQVENNRLHPYLARSEIQAGALVGRSLEVVYVDSYIDVFFLQVQGSGRVLLQDGSIMRLGYAGGNGRRYYAIGRELIKRGILNKANVSMQSIRTWLAANPKESHALMNLNQSYVFFRELKGPGPVGSLGVPLTPGRSIAVDRHFIPLGAPIWLQTSRPNSNPNGSDRPLHRLMMAQDTGGAIKGAVRGDVFWGHGSEAAAIAGRMKHAGNWFILLPNPLADRL